jgi:hypothetical protein
MAGHFRRMGRSALGEAAHRPRLMKMSDEWQQDSLGWQRFFDLIEAAGRCT